MSWFDIFILVFLVFMIFWGYRTGFFRSILRFISTIASIILSILLYPQVSEWLKNSFVYNVVNKPIYSFFSGIIQTPKLESALHGSGEMVATELTKQLPIPGAINPSVTEAVTKSIPANVSGFDAVSPVSRVITIFILNIIAIILVFIVVKFLLTIVCAFLVKLVEIIPIVRSIDKPLGATLGFIEGVGLIYLIVTVMIFMNLGGKSGGISDGINHSLFAGIFYNNNFLINLLLKH